MRRVLELIAQDLSQYIEAHTTAEPALLSELKAETQRDLEDPQMQVGRVEGALLRMLVALSGAKTILEVGTYSGYSALCMAAALPDGGRLITCDLDPVVTACAQRYFDRSPHGGKIELRLGDARETIAELARAGTTLDMVFLDADKEGYVHYWDAVLPMLRPGGLVVADNTLWSGKVLDPQAASDRGIVAFNSHVAQDARVEHVLLCVRDGIMLARKK